MQEGKAFTCEYGSSVRAHRAAGLVLPELSMEINREETTLGGTVLAKAIEDPFALTPALSAIPLRPMLPTQFSIYSDPTEGALGTTKLLRALNAEFTLGDRFAALWPINAAEPSYATTYETEPTSELVLMMEADAAGMGFLPVMRTGESRFVRVEAVGTGDDKFTMDLSCKVSDMFDFSDSTASTAPSGRSACSPTPRGARPGDHTGERHRVGHVGSKAESGSYGYRQGDGYHHGGDGRIRR